MTAQDHPHAPSAQLVALLDLIDRPAVAVGRGGDFLGANQRFHDFAHGVFGVWPGTLEGVLDADGIARIARFLEISGDADAQQTLAFRDGEPRAARLQRVRFPDGSAVALVVLLPAAAGPAATLRAESALRHDIAGPLTAILGTAELLLVRNAEMSREVRDGLGKILESCGRISEILASSRRGAHGNGR